MSTFPAGQASTALNHVRRRYRDADTLFSVPAGTTARLIGRNLLSTVTERQRLGVSAGEVTGTEIVRAAAWLHFRRVNASPDGHTREWLRQQQFTEGSWVILLCRDRRVALVVETVRLMS